MKISAPNRWRIEFIDIMGYMSNNIQVLEYANKDDLDEIFSRINVNDVKKITPLYITEYEHPELSKDEIKDMVEDIHNDVIINRLNKELSKSKEQSKEIEDQLKEILDKKSKV